MDPRTYAWNLLLVWPMERCLRFLADDLHAGAALSIVLFTLAVRAALLPMTLRQAHARRRLQSLRAPLEALKQHHAADAAALRSATAGLYRQHGINPASGALLTLLQLPLLFALYAALRDLSAHDLSFQAPWLWLPGLHLPDALIVGGQTVPGPLPILAAAIQWAQQRLMPLPTGTGDAPPDAPAAPPLAAAIGPLLTLWIGVSVSAGLALYWITQGLVGVAQVTFLRRLETRPAR